jgi:hypothetical protein
MIKAKDMQVFEILEEFDKTVGRSQKVNYLKQYREHTPLTYVLKFNYCDTIKSLIPEGRPPFNDEPDDGPSKASLWQYLNVFPNFVQSNQAAQVKPLQREKLFIEMLEAIAVEEANMIILAKDRELEKLYPSLDIGIVREAFPDLQIQTQQEAKELSEEEKKADILAVIQDKKEQLKSLQTEIKDLTKEAKAYSE